MPPRHHIPPSSCVSVFLLSTSSKGWGFSSGIRLHVPTPTAALPRSRPSSQPCRRCSSPPRAREICPPPVAYTSSVTFPLSHFFGTTHIPSGVFRPPCPTSHLSTPPPPLLIVFLFFSRHFPQRPILECVPLPLFGPVSPTSQPPPPSSFPSLTGVFPRVFPVCPKIGVLAFYCELSTKVLYSSVSFRFCCFPSGTTFCFDRPFTSLKYFDVWIVPLSFYDFYDARRSFA